ILSPSKKVYIDMQYDSSTVVGLHWAAYVQPQTTYDWDPATLSPGITESDILGIEAPLWSETIRNITAAMYLAVPRLPAMAEVAWTPQAERSWSDFRQRIAAHAPRWRLLGINYFPSPQISWF
ncbi:MAG TPA: family 20 glycosylhydrolase, partial [Gemmatimonadaceae bacterium]|nr:family 20 glycosylhydrolase [Gemmatimonadaceae bacterium]